MEHTCEYCGKSITKRGRTETIGVYITWRTSDGDAYCAVGGWHYPTVTAKTAIR